MKDKIYLSRVVYLVITTSVIVNVNYSLADDKISTPIKVDDFAPKANRFALSYGFDYGYSAKNSLSLTFVGAGNSSGASILIPLAINTEKHKHLASFNLGASTSVNDRLSLRSKVRALIGREITSHLNVKTGTNNYFKFGDVSVGASYKLGSLQGASLYSIFADYTILDNSSNKIKLGKSFSVGASASYISDPLLYTISVAYARVNSNYNTGKYQNLSGNYFIFSPSLTFAVNNTTNLNGGISAAFSLGNNNDKHVQELNASMYYGVTKKISDNTMLSVNFRNSLTGENSFGFSTNINQRF